MIHYSGDMSLASFLDHSQPLYQNVPYPTIDIRSIQNPIHSIQQYYQFFIPALFPQSISNDLLTSSDPTYISYTKEGIAYQHHTHGYIGKLPGFQFSKYNFNKGSPTIILSEKSFNTIFPNVPKEFNQLIIQLNPSLSKRDYAYIVDSTRSL